MVRWLPRPRQVTPALLKFVATIWSKKRLRTREQEQEESIRSRNEVWELDVERLERGKD